MREIIVTTMRHDKAIFVVKLTLRNLLFLIIHIFRGKIKLYIYV